MPSSAWYGRRWLLFGLYVALVFAMVPVARDVVIALRNSSLLSAAITVLYAAAFALVIHHVFFDLRHADWIAFLVVAALITLIAALLLGMRIPEERVHFLQYAAMGLLARNAFDRREGRSGALAAVALGGVLASVLGFLDEGFQGLLPRRAFDWRDVIMNTSAAWIALGLDELLHDRFELRSARRNAGARS
jgi:VanZ family protein